MKFKEEDLYQYKAQVTRIIDGDTLDVNIELGFEISYKMRIRMYGIDAPESRTRNKAEKVKGLETKEWLRAKVEDKDIVIKTSKDRKGKFGRYLCILIVDGVDLNKQMVKLGLAKEYFGGKRK